ncbi:PREDICTED: uncharacterized protein LOC109164599 [Ipomoea nil]|uniref:uncharacterized protein LOC109164599 n=1 Tax=Ipomoea nil TaxID=35883 RepID=UPI0009015B64|nr:PREDICTED: uncharacterized protein LOC109164599 [Ipomoea nil]
MSLTLLQGYSSAEEEEDDAGEGEEQLGYDKPEDDDDDGAVPQNRYKPLFNPNPSSSSSLPSALDAFSEVLAPPEFLNNSVQEAANDADNQRWRHGRRKNNRDKKDLPSGAVVEAKPQLVGIHERVRSDVEGTMPKTSTGQRSVSLAGSATSATAQGGKSSEDAADLMRICLTCGIPKTYSHSRGIVCPMCGDRPASDANTEAGKKKGSTIKDKEKSKRMKGQSSHASWKSETEMALRQQFD